MVLVGQNVICSGVRRKKLVTLHITGLCNVNGIQVFLGVCSVVWCDVGEVRSFLILWTLYEGNPLWENFYMQQLNHLQLIIDEQSPQKLNPLYTVGYIPRHLATRDGS
jgi:hypothetical protein